MSGELFALVLDLQSTSALFKDSDLNEMLLDILKTPNFYSLFVFTKDDVKTSRGFTPSFNLLLNYMSTCIVLTSSLEQHSLSINSQANALPDPLIEYCQNNGVLLGTGSNSNRVFLRIERRRKSGRRINTTAIYDAKLLQFKDVESSDINHTDQEIDFSTTFNLGLTRLQRERREKVDLPHYSAQAGTLDHGEIHYDVDKGDDFDEDEDADEDLLI
jgi:hypothetical protein